MYAKWIRMFNGQCTKCSTVRMSSQHQCAPTTNYVQYRNKRSVSLVSLFSRMMFNAFEIIPIRIKLIQSSDKLPDIFQLTQNHILLPTKCWNHVQHNMFGQTHSKRLIVFIFYISLKKRITAHIKLYFVILSCLFFVFVLLYFFLFLIQSLAMKWLTHDAFGWQINGWNEKKSIFSVGPFET